MKYLLHYGLQRSGTNYLEALLKKKYSIKILNDDSDRKHPIQKHFRLYDNKTFIPESKYENNLVFPSFADYEKSLELKKQIDGIIIISKDPYSWYTSYSNWAIKCNWPKANYHYIHEYNNFYAKWKEFAKQEPRIIFIKYIDLLTDSDNELRKIEEKFNLSHKFKLLNRNSKINIKKVSSSTTFSSDKYSFYKEKKYLSKLTQSEIEHINSILDVQLVNELNYEIENNIK